MERTEEQQELMNRLKKKTSIVVIIYILIFGIPAISSLFIVKSFSLDTAGSFVVLGISYLIAWGIAIYTYKYIKKQESLFKKKEKDNE